MLARLRSLLVQAAKSLLQSVVHKFDFFLNIEIVTLFLLDLLSLSMCNRFLKSLLAIFVLYIRVFVYISLSSV